ncbi:MAG TPA: hypothetical protein VJ464_26455 [Blastocatellia bacterium]|nr:hypothetical protein [Blastocatellia bacterium]
MIHYIVANDIENLRNSIQGFLQTRIEKEFEIAQGTTCAHVDEVLKKIREAGSDLHLIVLDMDFYGNILGGGLKILKALTLQQRRKVVVLSEYLDKKLPNGQLLGNEIVNVYKISPNRVLSSVHGPERLWKACASVLSEKDSDQL